MKSTEIRKGFLDFFEKKGHKIYESSSLLPKEDPTLLFTNAGMNQFKDILSGKVKSDLKRAASCQKCIRVSGKHNDLEEVGKDTTHHTFFEMLGNWSFGEYFKKEAIIWAWEYLTEVCKLPKEKLWASVYLDDDEAENAWYENTDLIKGRVKRFGKKDNFWEMGEVGPCGPCSEIHYDKGEEYSCGPNCGVNCPCGRFVEIWNLVFMQYYCDEKGKLTPLPAKNVDTGMGLDRLTAILQGKDSNYDTDLFFPFIKKVEELSGLKYKSAGKDESFRVIADHIRALGFAIADGAIPSNDGQGYVLRRILRRAARHGRLLGLHKPFIYKLSSTLVNLMGEVYPELKAKKEHVALVIKSEEERFEETLDLGLELFEKVASDVISKGEKIIPGSEVFKLYDTYGFPVDLTQVMANEKGLTVDMNGFEKELEKQRERSRVATGRIASGVPLAYSSIEQLPSSNFIGYENVQTESTIQFITEDGKGLVLDKTPFYSEAGGQISDTGIISNDNFEFEVTQAIKQGDKIIHLGIVKKGTIWHYLNKTVEAKVDVERRKSIMRNHTATHLLHKALREVLGEHVHQSGSLVAPDRLRFDFTHFKALEQAEIEEIEHRVNKKIWENLSVKSDEKTLEEAKKLGAMALFGEKYGEKVRMIEIENYSRELCGGTHVNATGEIGIFRIMSESAIASGIRRIEAVTGEFAYLLMKNEREILDALSFLLKSEKKELPERMNALLQNIKNLEKKTKESMKISAGSKVEELSKNSINLNGVNLITYKSDTEDKEALLKLADSIREKLKSTVAVLAAVIDGKISFVAAVTDDLIQEKKLKAGDIVGEVAKLTGGKGGGKPHLAQAGGKELEKLDEALEKLPEIIKKLLK
jgi:alanyl-tRNA synthetase